MHDGLAHDLYSLGLILFPLLYQLCEMLVKLQNASMSRFAHTENEDNSSYY